METKDFLQGVPKVKLTFSDAEYKERVRIACSHDVRRVLEPFFADCMQHHEEMHAILLNNANKVLGVVCLGVGCNGSVVCNSKALYQALILSNASGCIVGHNHPSGNPRPSHNDDTFVAALKISLEMLGFTLLDSIILTPDETYSYTNEGRL